MILGLTGGLGCGKTTAAQMIERHGFRRIDSDALVRTEVLTEPGVAAAVGTRFGSGVLATDGQIVRSRLAEIVFTDAASLGWLEELTHPRLFERWRTLLGAAPGANWVIEVPLLFEKQLENWFDFTLGVTSHSQAQLARLEQRGLPRALAEQRISKQLPLARKIELAGLPATANHPAGFRAGGLMPPIRRAPCGPPLFLYNGYSSQKRR